MQTIVSMLSPPIQAILNRLPEAVKTGLQEIRLREGRPLELIWSQDFGFAEPSGTLSHHCESAYRPTRADCAAFLEALTRHSLYSFEEEMKRGFITMTGGHRVGLAGKTLVEQGRVKSVKDVTGFNIRLAKEWKNSGRSLLPHLLDPVTGDMQHTLIVSPPCQGKTTLLRDLVRLLSAGPEMSRSFAYRLAGGLKRSYKVGVVDERSEIAASVRGIPTFDLGPRTDVLDGCPKAEGMMMMIRSLSPEVLAVDEIGRSEDAEAVQEALHAGIIVLATAHGKDAKELNQRPILRSLLEQHVFRRIVILRREPSNLASSSFVTADVFDEWGKRLMETKSALSSGGQK